MTGIIVYEQEGFSGQTYYFSDNELKQTITLTVKSTTTTIQNSGAVISIIKTGGATSAPFNTRTSVDNPRNGYNYMQINDLGPEFGTPNVDYPKGFTAIRNGESSTYATVT
jgi:hypothetical protein